MGMFPSAIVVNRAGSLAIRSEEGGVGRLTGIKDLCEYQGKDRCTAAHPCIGAW